MDKNLLKQDFFAEVNKKWLSEAKIPDDRSSIGSFVELDLALEKLLKQTLNDWSKDFSKIPNNNQLKNMVKFYQMVLDNSKRKELGWTPVKEHLQKIESFKSFSDIAKLSRDEFLEYSYLPLDFSVYEDFIDNTKRIVWLGELSTILPSKETYTQEKEKNKLLKVWSEMVFDLLIDYGKNEKETQELITSAIKFDDFYKDFVKSSVENADYVAQYNLKERDELNYSKWLKIPEILDNIIKQKVTEASVQNLKAYEKFDEIFCEANFNNYKAMLFIKNLLDVTPYLSEEIRQKAAKFRNAVYSIQKTRDLDNYAYDLTNKFFNMPLGMYYANTFFGEKAKKDVEDMVQSMINVYKARLQENTWLSKQTIEKALLKLSTFDVMVGYPEIIRPYYDNFIVKDYKEGGTLFTNVKLFQKEITEYILSLYHKSEDKRYWSMSPAVINAYYNPIKNHIVFPAAILAYPFYDIKQSRAANYGGIGAVIAHEISHGFDNNGAQFDEKGQLNNWWTDSDRQEFQKRTQGVIDLFDGQETEFGKVNGKLTVSENIADLGGFECALEAAQKEKDFDAKEFFINWATIWRSIYKEGAAKRQLDSDVHSPAKIRANVILSNNNLFNETFEITENDKMFVQPSKRVKIW
ncbi:M13 family metallopeptidase [Mycoplasma leonicaptivi]|uniref:M13 family metallopeptidase n=1 Tax=Mycoplasma leonicaptivi TaxID=36742 RepID=UPI00048651A4|nr:M13 family metallopeptidase [Mycoplasma leonicaptivi]